MFFVRVGRELAVLIGVDEEVTPQQLKHDLDELYIRADHRSARIAIIDADTLHAVAQTVSVINDDFLTIAVRDRGHGTGRSCIVTATGPTSSFKVGDTFELSSVRPPKRKALTIKLAPLDS